MSEITGTSTIVQSLNAGSGIDIKNLAQALADVAKVETPAKLEGKSLTMILTPK